MKKKERQKQRNNKKKIDINKDKGKKTDRKTIYNIKIAMYFVFMCIHISSNECVSGWSRNPPILVLHVAKGQPMPESQYSTE